MEVNKEREAFELALISKRIFDKADFENYMVFNADQNKYTSSAICTEDDEFAIDWANVGWRMWCEAKEQATPEGFVLLPIEPTKAIKTALSYQCFDFINAAQVYRKLGFDIPKKAEDEQSFFLHKFLILAIQHGNDFIKVFNDETKAMIEAQEQSHD